MDETELEDGEACAFQEDDDTSIDPDVALSYIDDKIQSVLGHFKKDFEGLVSIEKLGAKYGIYGSFLPTYRRSPVSSHSRSPSRLQNHMSSQSPNSVRMEGGHLNSLAQASAPHSVKHGSTSSSVPKPPFQNDQCRQTSRTQSVPSLEECTPKSEVCERKALKVRIKVGSDNLSLKENSAIYCGLGLDGSPSPSFEGSPMGSGGLSLVMPFEVDESTAQILRIMTSFPLDGGFLLSPLPYDLIQLSERPKLLQDILTQTSLKANQENSVIGQPKNNTTFSGDRVVKLLDKKGLSLQVKRDGEDSHVGFDKPIRESDIDVVSCEELLSDAFKLPLLSNADSILGESPKGSLKENGYLGSTKKWEPLELSLINRSLNDKPSRKENSVENVVHNSSVDAPREMASDSGKLGNNKGGPGNGSTNSDNVSSKSKKTSKSKLKDPLKRKGKKTVSCEGGKDQLFFGDKKIPNKDEAHGFDTRNEAMENARGHVSGLKSRNHTDTENRASRSDLRNSSMQKELDKSRDKYKDFFGDLNEQEADLMDSPDMASRGLKNSQLQVLDKAPSVYENALRERTSSLQSEGSDQFLSSVMKKQQSEKARTADAKESRLMNDLVFQQLVKPDDTFVKTNQHDEIGKHRAHCDLDGGDAKISMIKSKREPDQEFSTISKKLKTRSMQIGDNNCSTAKDQGNEILGVSSDNGLSTNTARKDQEFSTISKKLKTRSVQIEDNNWSTAQDQGNEILGVSSDDGPSTNTARMDQMTDFEFVSSRISKHNGEGGLLNTSDKSICVDAVSLHDSKSAGCSIAPRKRKADDFQHLQYSTPASDKLISDNEQHNKKKHRVSKSEGKERGARYGKSGKMRKSILQHSLDNAECLQKDSSSAMPVLVATSSSSKVSGSLKAKSNIQELKGSPMESVFPSTLNSGKLTSGNKSILEKSNVHDVVKVGKGSSVKYSDDDREGGDAQPDYVRKDLTDTGIHKGFLKQSVIDLHDKTNGNLNSDLTKISSSKFHYNGCADNLGPDRGYPLEAPASDRCVNEATGSESLCDITMSCSGRSLKDTFPVGDDKSEMLQYSSGNVKVKLSEFVDDQQDQKPDYEEKGGGSSFKDREKCGSNVDKTERDVMCHNEGPSMLKSEAPLDYDDTRSSMKYDANKKPKQLESTSKREKSHRLPPSDGEMNETTNCPQLYQGNGMSNLLTNASASDISKELKTNKKANSQSRTRVMSKHSISNGHRIKNQDTPSPLRRDASSEAARNAIKEARNLKHLADRLKKSTGSSESTGLYFEAALKFLHGASLVESGRTENARLADTVESMKIYGDTAELCGFCAREYEKSKDMAMAALAYKCTEVAYMRVVCSSHQSASRDRDELQTALQIVPPGESPSSSASDIDNLNNSATGDKALRARSTDAPQLSADLVLTARNSPNFNRLLSFAQNVNSAMEASRKSRIALTAANVSMDRLGSKEGINSIKRALDFNFHDVDGLLRLVRLAKEVIASTE